MPKQGRKKAVRSIEERNKLVEDNHGLVLAFLNRNHFSENDIFDYYGAACEGLINACDSYNESLGVTFATYAYTCIERSVAHEYFKHKRQMEIPAQAKISIDKPVNSLFQSEGELSKTVQDLLVDTTTPIEDTLFSIDLAKIYHKYTYRERDIIYDKIRGFSFVHIGKKWGLSKQRVQQIFERFKKDVAVYEGMCDNER